MPKKVVGGKFGIKPKPIPERAKNLSKQVSQTSCSHRKSGLPTDLKIRVRSNTLTAVRQYAEEYVMSSDAVVWGLIEFYRLENLQLLTERLHAKFQSGITPVERAQLGILYTMLGEIDRISGL